MSNFRKPTMEESFDIRPKHPVNPTDINWKSVAIYAGVTIVVTTTTCYIIYKVIERNNDQWAAYADQSAQDHLDAIVKGEKRITLLEEQLRQEKARNVPQVASPITPTSFTRVPAVETKPSDNKGVIDQNTNISDIE